MYIIKDFSVLNFPSMGSNILPHGKTIWCGWVRKSWTCKLDVEVDVFQKTQMKIVTGMVKVYYQAMHYHKDLTDRRLFLTTSLIG